MTGRAAALDAELLTAREAGEVLGLHPATVRRYADAGQLTMRRTLGNHLRYVAAEVWALRAERSQRPRRRKRVAVDAALGRVLQGRAELFAAGEAADARRGDRRAGG